ncbi:glycosyltransferase [Algoriphagus sp. C2-6-M1]|uniref:glycosyltransferase n=1 Tax=Algoriphagus persicinus TaxID=3108754 RepID=UPI002B3A2174|nr:glycosyltransferase [Algoriphagus sp. C2-6-M1]MEB2782626.1 glycosyltransferase [Algoriphagus sp. C2-6-M1]
MKSVAVLLTNSFKTSYGGIGPFVKNLDTDLAKYYDLTYFSLPDSFERVTWMPHRLAYIFYLFLQLPRLRKYDLIVSHTPEGSYVVSLFGLPFAHVYHGNGNPVSKSRFWYGKYFTSAFDHIQKRIKKYSLISYTVGETMSGAKKLVNPIAHQVKEKDYLSRSGFIFAGRLENGKRIDEIIRIYSKLPIQIRESNSLYIAGKGSLRESFERLAIALGIAHQVIFLGNLDNHDLIEVISKKKIMLMASENEGFPMSIAEALSVGVPIVSTAVGDIPSFIVSQHNGELVEKNLNVEEYLFAIKRILDFYPSYAEGALESSKVFDSKKISESLVYDLNELMLQNKFAPV